MLRIGGSFGRTGGSGCLGGRIGGRGRGRSASGTGRSTLGGRLGVGGGAGGGEGGSDAAGLGLRAAPDPTADSSSSLDDGREDSSV